ncbi:TIGR02530 family flagellar biosynthesis protein [Thermovenabulum sp.]|uniref:TIGR02530 family flagellar biosynthesis protein n=1 Tax=Thermovenabulum sp. TaxID=3100335 RepID=UPI003C7EA445
MSDFIRISDLMNPLNTIVEKVDKNKYTVEKQEKVKSDGKFKEILEEKLKQDLKISGHAAMRMKLRNMNLSQEQWDKLKNAVSKAEEKGVKESLILMDNMAFIVSIKNKTVITAIDEENLKENVFTNIDGAVII